MKTYTSDVKGSKNSQEPRALVHMIHKRVALTVINTFKSR